MDNTAAVILAGGLGKRMKSEKPKVLQEVLFKPMIDWVAGSAEAAGIHEICVVTGQKHEQVEEYLAGRYETVLQNEQLGTGHAALMAADFIKKHKESDVLILCGDAPFVNEDVIRSSLENHRGHDNSVTVITAVADNPYGYGRILRDDYGNVCRCVEEKDADTEIKLIKEINGGIYWFKASALLDALAEIKNDNAQNEYYLTDTIEIINKKGLKSGTYTVEDMGVIAAANDRAQLFDLNEMARRMVIEKLFIQGVSVIDDSGVIVSPDAEIGADTVLLPGTIIKGKVKIGKGCTIGPNSLICDCNFGDNVVFNASQAYQSVIDSGVTVGPFAHIRPNSHLRDKVHVGDFVEIKNSDIGEGTKVGHLTYVGDADVGKKVNFGCGCVTVNYDGVEKHRTKVGDNAFIGCNTNLVAPVEVGDNAYTAAGSTITKKVPENALAVARSRQENLKDWVLRKHQK